MYKNSEKQSIFANTARYTFIFILYVANILKEDGLFMKQPTYPDLEAMRNIDIESFDPDTIPDAQDIVIDTSKPLPERALDYINQTGNPYFVRSGKILAKIEYSETETSIEDCVEGYFRSL